MNAFCLFYCVAELYESTEESCFLLLSSTYLILLCPLIMYWIDHLVGMTMCMKLTPGGGGGVMPPPHLLGLLGTFWACMGLEAQTPWFAQHTVCAMWMPSTHMSCCPITLLLTNNGKEFKDDPTRACQVLPKHGV